LVAIVLLACGARSALDLGGAAVGVAVADAGFDAPADALTGDNLTSQDASSAVDSSPSGEAGLGGRDAAVPAPVAVAVGGGYGCALLSDTTVDCWGANELGQLGDRTSSGPASCEYLAQSYACSTKPVAVSGLSGVTAIAAGQTHTCALLLGGTVECWGNNQWGQLGDGTAVGPEMCQEPESPTAWACSTKPVTVSGLSGVSAITAGGDFTCALLLDGTVECWGDGTSGQLGVGMSTGSSTPLNVSGLTHVSAIAAGYDHACALLSDGTVECWGDALGGELGDGTSQGPEKCMGAPCSSRPVPVSGLSGVTAIAASRGSTCALLSVGTVVCWGDNQLGELGDGTASPPYGFSTTPVAVSALSAVNAIAGGGVASCALLQDGTVKCWGSNQDGELGDGTSTVNPSCNGDACSTTPVMVSGLHGVAAIADGDGLGCALLVSGAVECWGDNVYGELGVGTSTGPQGCLSGACSTTPVTVVF
jgi:alpha-tubulin suppressor-like RCC1 family protein